MITVCTGFSPAGFDEYGKRFLARFHAFWPADVGLRYYTEEPVEAPRGTCASLWDCDGARDFIARHRDNPERRGTKPHAKWKPRYIGRPYNYRFDAVKFFRQCMIPANAAQGLADGDILVWLDADVMTLARIPEPFVAQLLGGHELVYLGRAGTHSEIGFWAVRLNPRTRAFLNEFAAIWRCDRVFELDEWHSAFVFDHCRRLAQLDERNLTPNGRGHVWIGSPLAPLMDHLKGRRKALGRSPEYHRKTEHAA